MSEDYEYPFDPEGTASTNLIVNEEHIITPPEDRHFYFVVPFYAPFFKNGLTITHYPSGAELVDGVDFALSYKFVSATFQTSMPVYGAISIFDLTLSGTLRISYQTLGGKWAINETKALELLSDAIHNPRVTTWEQVVELPESFPVIDHEHSFEDMVGMDEVVEKIGQIALGVGYNADMDTQLLYNTRQYTYQGNRADVEQWQKIAIAPYDPDTPQYVSKRATMLATGANDYNAGVSAVETLSIVYKKNEQQWYVLQNTLTETEGALFGVRNNTDDGQMEIWAKLPPNVGRYAITVLSAETDFQFTDFTPELVATDPGSLTLATRDGFSKFSTAIDTLANMFEDAANTFDTGGV